MTAWLQSIDGQLARIHLKADDIVQRLKKIQKHVEWTHQTVVEQGRKGVAATAQEGEQTRRKTIAATIGASSLVVVVVVATYALTSWSAAQDRARRGQEQAEVVKTLRQQFQQAWERASDDNGKPGREPPTDHRATVTDEVINQCAETVRLQGDAPTPEALYAWANALSLARSGDTRAQATHAISLYTQILDRKDLPAAWRPVIHDSRGKTYAQLGMLAEADADFSDVLSLPETTANKRSELLVSRGYIRYKNGRPEEAITDFCDVIKLPNASPQHRASALIHRGFVKELMGNLEEAVNDYATAANTIDADAVDVNFALFSRAALLARLGRPLDAISEFGNLIGKPGWDQYAVLCLQLRGTLYTSQGQINEAITDFTTLLARPDADAAARAKALLSRGRALAADERWELAIRDYTLAVQMMEMDWSTEALIDRGRAHFSAGQQELAQDDFTQASVSPIATPDQRSLAFRLRGSIQRRPSLAIADYTSALEVAGTSAPEVANSLYFRGVIRALFPETRESGCDDLLRAKYLCETIGEERLAEKVRSALQAHCEP